MCIRELSNKMMYDSIPLCIRFKLESFSTKSVCLHLVGEKLLRIFYMLIQFCVYVRLRLTIFGKKVDESHHRTRILCVYKTCDEKKQNETYRPK